MGRVSASEDASVGEKEARKEGAPSKSLFSALSPYVMFALPK